MFEGLGGRCGKQNPVLVCSATTSCFKSSTVHGHWQAAAYSCLILLSQQPLNEERSGAPFCNLTGCSIPSDTGGEVAVRNRTTRSESKFRQIKSKCQIQSVKLRGNPIKAISCNRKQGLKTLQHAADKSVVCEWKIFGRTSPNGLDWSDGEMVKMVIMRWRSLVDGAAKYYNPRQGASVSCLL